MIELDVKDYCQNCKYFKVKQATLTHYLGDGTEECYVILKCENADKCNNFYKHITNVVKED